MKRFMLAAIILSSFGFAGAAQAGCTTARGGSAGEYDQASTTFGNVTITAEQYGNFASGPAYLCSDGSFGVEPASRGSLVITVDGDEVCRSTVRLSEDPFGFGAGVHSPPADPCGAEISFDGVTAIPTVSPDDIVPDSHFIRAGFRKEAPVTGSFWYDGATRQVPSGAMGYYTRGVGAASEG